jgi:hypothetical protein
VERVAEVTAVLALELQALLTLGAVEVAVGILLLTAVTVVLALLLLNMKLPRLKY